MHPRNLLRATPCVALALALSAAVAAQTATVSPAIYTNAEGNFRNGWPWQEEQMRYQQIHADLGPQPFVITGMAFRADGYYGHRYGGNYSGSSYGTPRSSDIEVVIGDSSFPSRSNVFANNFLSAPTQVVNRRFVSLPAYGPGTPATAPAPFDLVIPFDVPFGYLGQDDLCWEIRIFANSLGRTEFYPVDGFLNCTDCNAEYTYRNHGIGCSTPTAGAGLWFRIYTETFSRTSTGFSELLVHGFRAPPSSAVAINVGFSNPMLSVPSLCTPVYASPDAQILVNADQTGRFRDESSRLFVPLNSGAQGVTLFSQAVALDSSQASPFLGIALSQGIEVTIPEITPEHNVRRIYDNSAGAPGNPTGRGPFGSGLVTQFRH